MHVRHLSIIFSDLRTVQNFWVPSKMVIGRLPIKIVSFPPLFSSINHGLLPCSLTNGHKPINHPYKNVKIHPSLLWNEYTDLNTTVEINKKIYHHHGPLAATLKFLHFSVWQGWRCQEVMFLFHFLSFFMKNWKQMNMTAKFANKNLFTRGPCLSRSAASHYLFRRKTWERERWMC